MAHEEWKNLLGGGQARSLLNLNDLKELSRRALVVEGKVNLLSVYEKMAIKEALGKEGPARRFFAALCDLLEAEKIGHPTFTPFAEAVHDLPHDPGRARVATWPIATLFPFLAQPDKHMFLKPEITKTAAENLGFDLHYDSTPNWRTYEALLRMGTIYREQIAPLKPRDFIDVQSFFFVTCGGYD